MSGPLSVAVVGSGAAGIAAAHLLSRRHRVTLFEKDDRVGGHVNTVVVPDGPDAGTPVDTGFIVLNDKNYPTLHRLLAQLGVSWRWSDMSFGFHCERTGFQYAGTDLLGLFAQPANALSPRFWGMIADISRFCSQALKDLEAGALGRLTLGEYAASGGYGDAFLRDYLVPMGAAIWSAPFARMLEFPAETFARFFKNHGLLSLKDRPRWQTVVGGSHAYVKAFRAAFRGDVRSGCPVRSLRRETDAVRLRLGDGTEERYDRAVVAAHADEALALLEDPSPEERRLLGAWRYQSNTAVLHTDESVLPPLARARASWNCAREAGAADDAPVSITYDMNRLQGLRTRRRYCVTLNRRKPVSQNDIIRVIRYAHPVYDRAAAESQRGLPSLNGARNTFFCGSYFGYGFHEDAVRSGAAAAEALGGSW